MITAIEIENFKGIGSRQRIEIRPLTLVFGKNSAGKSSLFHALFFLQDLLSHGQPRFQAMDYFSPSVNLESFEHTVHNQDTSLAIAFRLEVDMEESSDGSRVAIDYACTRLFEGKATVDLLVKQIKGRAAITRFEFRQEDRPMLLVELDDSSSRTKYRMKVNSSNWEDCVDFPCTVDDDSCVDFESFSEFWFWTTPTTQSRFGGPPKSEQFDENEQDYLNRFMPEIVGYFRNCLNDMLYVGPLRDIPPRIHRSKIRKIGNKYLIPTLNWASGIGAWEYLATSNRSNVDEVNRWLETMKMDVGIHLDLSKTVQSESALDMSIEVVQAQSLLDKGEQIRVPRLRVQDVGCGVSQVVPVIVALIADRRKLVMIEQPELHLHPSLQTELGDLFLSLTNDAETRAIVETHSEHLILRVLRRIRETNEKELSDEAPLAYPENVSVYFFDHSMSGVRAVRLRINSEGEFIDAWPYGFFDERVGEMYS